MVTLEELKKAKKIRVTDKGLPKDFDSFLVVRNDHNMWMVIEDFVEGDLHERSEPLTDEEVLDAITDDRYNLTMEIIE